MKRVKNNYLLSFLIVVGFTTTQAVNAQVEVIGSGTDETTSAFITLNNSNDTLINILDNGFVGIGTNTPQSKLAVEGSIDCRAIKVSLDTWADYVFDEDYKLSSLKELEEFISEHHHLPDVPSEENIINSGSDLGKMDAILLKKIEKMTLYVIQQNKQIEQQSKEIEMLKENIEDLK